MAMPKIGHGVPKIGHQVTKYKIRVPKSGHDVPKSGHQVALTCRTDLRGERPERKKPRPGKRRSCDDRPILNSMSRHHYIIELMFEICQEYTMELIIFLLSIRNFCFNLYVIRKFAAGKKCRAFN